MLSTFEENLTKSNQDVHKAGYEHEISIKNNNLQSRKEIFKYSTILRVKTIKQSNANREIV
jgi:hypothetical protein